MQCKYLILPRSGRIFDLKKMNDQEKLKTTSILLDSFQPTYILVWTDGSAENGTSNGGGAAVIVKKIYKEVVHIRPGAICSSYIAEMAAIEGAL